MISTQGYDFNASFTVKRLKYRCQMFKITMYQLKIIHVIEKMLEVFLKFQLKQ